MRGGPRTVLSGVPRLVGARQNAAMFAVAPELSTVPRFGIAGWTIVLIAMGYLVVLALQGHRAFLRLRVARPTDPGALVVFYRRNVTRKIGLLLPVALLLLVVPGLRPAHLAPVSGLARS
jgi:hypothetical protein